MDANQCAEAEKPQDSPFMHIRELYAPSLYPFLGGISFKNSESSGGDDTDASSLQDVEAEYDVNTLKRAEINEVSFFFFLVSSLASCCGLNTFYR